MLKSAWREYMSGWPSGLRRQTQEILHCISVNECSGLHLEAWVRIPLLTKIFILHNNNFLGKFIWVRHPFERILSAFRNKLEHPFTPEFQMRYGRKIIKQFRPMASQESLKNGADVSITEFIKYIINTGNACHNLRVITYEST